MKSAICLRFVLRSKNKKKTISHRNTNKKKQKSEKKNPSPDMYFTDTFCWNAVNSMRISKKNVDIDFWK